MQYGCAMDVDDTVLRIASGRKWNFSVPRRLQTLTLNMTAGAPHLKSGDEASTSSDAGQVAPAWQADICASELQGVAAVEHPALRLLPIAGRPELPLYSWAVGDASPPLLIDCTLLVHTRWPRFIIDRRSALYMQGRRRGTTSQQWLVQSNDV